MSQSKQWFAIRVTYNREMKVKRELDSLHIENFLPMTHRIVIRGERKIKELVPAIHNLIFVYITSTELKSYKATTSLPIRYIMNKETHDLVSNSILSDLLLLQERSRPIQ